MINGKILDELHALRRESCTCGTVMIMPEFHAADCAYKPLGEQKLKEAENEKPVDTE